MGLTWTYSHPTTPAGPGTSTEITTAVQVSPDHKLTSAAAVGDSSIMSIMVEDHAAAYDFKGLWRMYVIESACDSADHYAWNGYVGKQTISRGAGTDVMYPVTTGRRWSLELAELSSLAGFRVISGDDGNRPAETINARLAWLIGTLYLPVFDNGLIASDTTALDANDYRGQYANDVLNDMAVQIGFNWWIYYDQAAADGEEVSLAFFDPDSSLYSSSIKISNVKADIDNSTVFAPYEEGDVERDPQKIAAGVYLPYAGGAVYEYDYTTSYTFALRDQVGPTASIKTAAKAIALADRFLDENADQDERANLTIRLPAAQLNDIKHGQRMQVKLQHVPGWESYRWCRAVRKTFAPPANRTQAYYDVDLELAPSRTAPMGAFGYFTTGNGSYATPVLPDTTTPGRLLLLVVSQQNTAAGAPAPTTPEFRHYSGVVDATWTEVGFVTAISADASTHCAYGIYARLVATAEETTRPVVVRPRPSDNFKIGAWLWEIAGGSIPTLADEITSDTLGRTAEGATIALGSTLSGFVVGGFCIAVADFGHRLTITPSIGVTVEAATSFNDGNAPVSSPSGMDPPYTWIGAKRGATGLAASWAAPYDVYTDQAFAGVACVVPGLTKALPHINYAGDSPPNVTT